jgi:hypothetical protein
MTHANYFVAKSLTSTNIIAAMQHSPIASGKLRCKEGLALVSLLTSRPIS